MQNKLSVVLATFNEEENLERCLMSIKRIAGEVVVVDGGSSDRTVEVARKLGARIIVTDNPPIFHINKQKALEAAKGRWILQLDADEVVSEKLASEIDRVVGMSEERIRGRQMEEKKRELFLRHQRLVEMRDGKIGAETGETAAFFISRRNWFLGRFLRYGGTYPDGVIRLVKKGKAYFPCQSVHEQIQVDGRVDWLENDLWHYDSPTFSKYLVRANRYTSLTAREFAEAKVGVGVFDWLNYVLIKPVRAFLLLFVRHKGFLDGFPGFAWALFSGLHYPLAYFKYWSRKRNGSPTPRVVVFLDQT